MAEAKRGCGFRKAGGIYVVGDLGGIPVDWLPFCLAFPHSRALAWVPGWRVFETAGPAKNLTEEVILDAWRANPRVGLMWVGEKHYTPESFIAEAKEMGVSKRVAGIPVDLKPGDPIVLAHTAAIPIDDSGEVAMHCQRCMYVPQTKAIANALADREAQRRIFAAEPKNFGKRFRLRTSGDPRHVAGAITCFHMRAIEVVLPASTARDPEIVRRCAERGVEIITVPDGDPDHVPAGWKLPAFLRDDAEPELALPPAAVSDLEDTDEA